MATTRLIPMHKNIGKSVSACLEGRTNYAMNPAKTEGGELVTTYECCAETVEQEFLLSRHEYHHQTGRDPKGDVIAYHLRQSFKPGEVSPERANQIGYQLAEELTKGDHAFVVATHTDKAHIHNHIIFNSTNLTGSKKWRNFKNSAKEIRKISDRLCLENDLSIVEHPKEVATTYSQWLDEKPKSQREELRQVLDNVFCYPLQSTEDFVRRMNKEGYEVKQGKYLAFRKAGQKRFIRMNSLGMGYVEVDLYEKFPAPAPQRSVQRLISIQEKLQAGKGEGYAHWATIFNIKEMSNTLIFLQNQNLLNQKDLDEKIEELETTISECSTEMKGLEQSMSENKTMQTHVRNYLKTKEVAQAYQQSGYSKKFFEAHREQLTLRKAAKSYFNSHNLKKLPTIQSLRQEYSQLSARKSHCYGDYGDVKAQLKPLLTARENVNTIMKQHAQQRERKPIFRGR